MAEELRHGRRIRVVGLYLRAPVDSLEHGAHGAPPLTKFGASVSVSAAPLADTMSTVRESRR